MTRKILFRADAKPSIGTGDLMSLISLSRHFIKAGWKPYFMIRGYEAALKIAEKFSISNLTILAPDCNLEDEVKTINALCEREKISVAFFEITERELSEYKGLSNAFKKAAVSFDGVLIEDMSLVVSWTPDWDQLFQPDRHPSTKFLLGYQYVTLPPDYFDDERIRNRQYKKVPERLLVAMGGADEYNLTQFIVDALAGGRVNVDVTIIIGGGYEYWDRLEKSLASSTFSYVIKHNVTNMLDEYLGCDMAIATGGLTASELVASRTPALLIAAYEHQIGRCTLFEQHGWIMYSGYRRADKRLLLDFIAEPLLPMNKPTFETSKIVEAVCEQA